MISVDQTISLFCSVMVCLTMLQGTARGQDALALSDHVFETSRNLSLVRQALEVCDSYDWAKELADQIDHGYVAVTGEALEFTSTQLEAIAEGREALAVQDAQDRLANCKIVTVKMLAQYELARRDVESSGGDLDAFLRSYPLPEALKGSPFDD